MVEIVPMRLSTCNPKRILSFFFFVAAVLYLGCASFLAHGAVTLNTLAQAAAPSIAASSIERLPAAGVLEVAFSPNRGAELLVLKVIDTSRSTIHLMAYSFTSANITRSLLGAIKRGVKVYIVVDEKHNFGDSASRHARVALSTLSSAGAHVRVISAYPIHHDKVIVADGRHTQIGSFNYSAAAANRNSENVLVNWDNIPLATSYTKHFEKNWSLGKKFNPGY